MNDAQPHFFTRTSDIWHAMYEDCRRAQKSIEIDQYIMENDEVGRKFLSLLAEKAMAGVAVHLLLDFVGSYSAYNSEPIKTLTEVGGTVRFYNPLPRHRLLWPAKWFPRNHVKLLLVDSDIAYVGSACMRDDMAAWRDTTVRLQGTDADAVERYMGFARLLWWKRAGKVRKEALSHDGRFMFSLRRPGMGINPIYRSMIHAVRRAQVSICIETPYFLAPYALRRAIRMAAKRGVRVQIITNARSDVWLADFVSASYFNKLMKKGVEIYAYQPFMLHAKVMVVDGNWASLGSSNIDYLSMRVNREANLVVHDESCVAVLRQQFEADLAESVQVELSAWRARPYWQRALGYLGRSIKAVL